MFCKTSCEESRKRRRRSTEPRHGQAKGRFSVSERDSPPPPPPSPVHAGVSPVVVEGLRRAHAALLALLPAVRRDGEGGATAAAGRHAGAVAHGGGAGDGCGETRREVLVPKAFGSNAAASPRLRPETREHTGAGVWCFSTRRLFVLSFILKLQQTMTPVTSTYWDDLRHHFKTMLFCQIYKAFNKVLKC